MPYGGERMEDADNMFGNDIPNDDPISNAVNGLEPYPEGHPAGNREPVLPKEDPSRFQYWQSQADQYKKQFEDVKAYLPVVEYLRSNPDVINGLVQQRNNPQGMKQTLPEPEKLVAPTEPQRPSDYNEEDALIRGTSSYKYEQDLKKFDRDMMGYERKLLAQEREAMKAENENLKAYQQQMVEQQRQAQAQAQLKQELVMQHGLKVNEVDMFLREMDDPSTVDMPTLVEFWRFRQSRKAQGGGTQISKEEMQRRAQELLNKQNKQSFGSIAGAGGSAPQQYSEEDMFNAALVTFGRK